MVVEFTYAIQNGLVRPVGIPATGRSGGDIIHASRIEVMLGNGSKRVIMPDVRRLNCANSSLDLLPF
jgi:hypothetical protein